MELKSTITVEDCFLLKLPKNGYKNKEEVMLLFLIVVLAQVIFVWKKSRGKGKIDVITNVLLTALVGSIVFLLSSALLLAVIPTEKNNIEKDKAELVAVSFSKDIAGNFFLATGSFNSGHSYIFYYKTADGGMKFGSLNANNVTVYEEDRKDGYMVRIGIREAYSSDTREKYKWIVPFFWSSLGEEYGTWAIHVPKGTVLREFKLDLSKGM